MPEESGGEKTLPASPHKRERAREEGNVARSQDLSSALALLAALLLLSFLGRQMLGGLVVTGQHFIGGAAWSPIEPGTARHVCMDAMAHLSRCVLPFMLLLMAAGVAANVMQVGFVFAPKVVAPKIEKIDPITGFRKFFNRRSFVELIKSFVKLVVIGYVVYIALRHRWDAVLRLGSLTPAGMVKGVAGLAFAVWFRIGLVMLVLGILDYGFQRWQYEQDLRMTVLEAKEELRRLEGDPRIKQRVRQIQRQMAMQRMMAEVPKADVVITNPTTYAVALRYDMDKMEAPVVVAKGARLLAERIREIAVRHEVPIVEKADLARTLYRTMNVGQAVPETLFRAVAEVLAFVYRIDRRADKVRERARTMQIFPSVTERMAV